MIDINTWPPSVAIAFGFAPFVISLSGVAMETYIARSRDFDLIIASLPNSLWLKQQIPFWGTTRLKSRCYLLSTICGAMLYPKLCIRLGMMDAEDLRTFSAAASPTLVDCFLADHHWFSLAVYRCRPDQAFKNLSIKKRAPWARLFYRLRCCLFS
ncbi:MULTISPECIES: hypothetical protein [Pseudomonas]|uniref:hypothetical protein n=1 Tax=Pseudomonas TaxID=286 RepID=UPI000579922F|nr:MULTISPECIES: hypothetical protein [Pseudomonas]